MSSGLSPDGDHHVTEYNETFSESQNMEYVEPVQPARPSQGGRRGGGGGHNYRQYLGHQSMI